MLQNSRKSNPMLHFVIAILLIYSFTAVYPSEAATASSPTFIDTDGHWAQNYISWAVEEQLAAGYADGSFKPNKPISEPEFLTMLLRAYNLVPLSSVAGGAWYTPYYDYALEHGWPVTYATTINSFHRGQAAHLIASAAVGKSFSETSAIQWLLDEEISNGRTSATVNGFEAGGLLTRAEALTFFYNLKQHSSSLASAKIKPVGYKLGGIAIGDDGQRLEHLLGSPIRIEASGYSFDWHIYNTGKSYERFLMAGMQNNRVVALFSSSEAMWQTETGIEPGITIADAKSRTGAVQDAASGDDYYMYTADGVLTTLFIDRKDGNKVSGMLLIKSGSASTVKHSAAIQTAFEQQTFDLANAERSKRGIPLLVWDKLAASSARAHSVDMGGRNFFGHYNPDGKSPFDRMDDKGVRYRMAAENIAAGYPNSIYAHYGWMNSDSGHRETLLNSKMEKLGTGVGFGSSTSSYNIYYTQNFYTP
ncbi:CAP domain-containing protein [Paenibacillus harenae]|uniref:CAP domain-containing protein n=1 Tax=Paenibacillus harenae TaxID=306543 RepID=UPI00278FE8E0|nr:CAP domain-containing protein [Paenibacillus harenae]MDQ0059638.1 uncharacterized protein YkwD [Paenibacillus harenae]